MTDVLLILLGVLLLLLGFIGAFLPVLPGPPLSFLGLFVFSLLGRVLISGQELFIFGFLALLVTLLDFWFPIYGTKKTGGNNRGMWGAALGLVIGIFFFPPFGIVVGPFVGALLGELSAGNQGGGALRAAFGSLLGLFAGVLVKFFYAVAVTVFVLVKLF